jgi:hypothetical protein
VKTPVRRKTAAASGATTNCWSLLYSQRKAAAPNSRATDHRWTADGDQSRRFTPNILAVSQLTEPSLRPEGARELTPILRIVELVFAPEGQLSLARHFSAGWGVYKEVCVPSGRLRPGREIRGRAPDGCGAKRRKIRRAGRKGLPRHTLSSVPTGRDPFLKMPHPALKCRAKLNCPSGAQTGSTNLQTGVFSDSDR